MTPLREIFDEMDHADGIRPVVQEPKFAECEHCGDDGHRENEMAFLEGLRLCPTCAEIARRFICASTEATPADYYQGQCRCGKVLTRDDGRLIMHQCNDCAAKSLPYEHSNAS